MPRGCSSITYLSDGSAADLCQCRPDPGGPHPAPKAPSRKRCEALTGAKLLGTTNVDTQDAMLALAKEIYK